MQVSENSESVKIVFAIQLIGQRERQRIVYYLFIIFYLCILQETSALQVAAPSTL